MISPLNKNIRVYSNEEGYRFTCKECLTLGGPFNTREKRQKAILLHLKECAENVRV